MTLNATETIAKAAGDIYIAPAGTAAPTDEAALDHDTLVGSGSDWVHGGWLHEDGPDLEGLFPETSRLKGWNRQAPIRTLNRFGEPAVVVPYLQWNAENMLAYFPGATHDAANGVIKLADYGNATAVALLVVVRDGDRALGFWFAQAEPHGSEAFSFPADDGAVIPVTYDVLAPSSGDTFRAIGIDVAS